MNQHVMRAKTIYMSQVNLKVLAIFLKYMVFISKILLQSSLLKANALPIL